MSANLDTLGPASGSIRLSATLSLYLGRQVLTGIGIVLLTFATLAFLIDTIELLRRAGDREGVGFGAVMMMAGLHLPFLVQAMLPFAMLFGAMLTFMRLTRSNELVAVRALGVSVWQFLFPALTIAVAIGVFAVTAFNPFAAATYTRFERMEERHLGASPSLLAVSGGGLWLRQREEQQEVIFHARVVGSAPLAFEDVTVLYFEDNVRFSHRIDAPRAELLPGMWRLDDAVQFWADGRTQRIGETTVPTDLAPDRIQEGFAAPETMSFWDLPGYIALMEDVGFPAREHRLYFHGLLALPLLLSAMLLIGTTFSLRLVRRGGTGLLVTGGLVTGFVFYILADVVFAIGLSGRLPVVLAAWTPAGVAVLLGLTTLLYLEDG